MSDNKNNVIFQGVAGLPDETLTLDIPASAKIFELVSLGLQAEAAFNGTRVERAAWKSRLQEVAEELDGRLVIARHEAETERTRDPEHPDAA